MIWVEKANYLREYKVKVTFSDGKSKTINLKNVILKDKRKIFKELHNLDKFKRFKVDMDTIVWENGLDLAPEFLYEISKSGDKT